MGNGLSQPVLQDHVNLLSNFAGGQTIDQDDQFWRQLFAFPISLSQLPPSQVEQHITECCAQLGQVYLMNLHRSTHVMQQLCTYCLYELQLVTMGAPKIFRHSY